MVSSTTKSDSSVIATKQGTKWGEKGENPIATEISTSLSELALVSKT